jgi:hypothetical protein
MFTVAVEWDVKRQRVREPAEKYRRVFSYPPCDAEGLLKALQIQMDSMVGKFAPS